MQILAARLQHMGNSVYANSPQLEILVDKEPDRSLFRYQTKKIPDGFLHFASSDGWVSFMAEMPGNQRGFGGRAFRITTVRGKNRTIIGPWSSRAGAIHAAGFRPYCVEVNFAVNSSRQTVHNWHASYSGCITLDKAMEAIRLIPLMFGTGEGGGGLHVALAKVRKRYAPEEIYFTPILVKDEELAGKLLKVGL